MKIWKSNIFVKIAQLVLYDPVPTRPLSDFGMHL